MGRPHAQLAFENRELVKKRTHFHIRVDAEVELTSVRRTPCDLNLDP